MTEPQHALDFLLSRPALASQFSTVFSAHPDREVMALLEGMTLRPAKLNMADRSYFRDTVQQGHPVIFPLNSLDRLSLPFGLGSSGTPRPRIADQRNAESARARLCEARAAERDGA